MKSFKQCLKEADSTLIRESGEFDPDDEAQINEIIADILTQKFGGKAWFKGGSYAYLFDVNNPTVAKGSDGAVVKCGSWAKCIDGWCDNAHDFFSDFYDGYGDDTLYDYFRPVKDKIPMARDGAPAYGGEQERHELANMQGESIEALKKLAGI